MLARVVENIYWLARYVERAENTARLIGVNTHLLLDLPAGYAPGWSPLIDITGGRALFDERGASATERNVVHFLLADTGNPGSLASSLKFARENARTLRDILPTDAWELLNQFCLEFPVQAAAGLSKRTRFTFMKHVIFTLEALTGSLEGTINRNDAYTFLNLGRYLERADMTSRIVDVRSAQLVPQGTPDLRPFDTIQWMSVLRSLSGYQMYRLGQRTRVSGADVLEFLLGGEQFPRACLFCLQQIEQRVCALPRSEKVFDALARACTFLREAQFAALDQTGLHALIDQLQLHFIQVHEAIALTYFPTHPASMQQSSTSGLSAGQTLTCNSG